MENQMDIFHTGFEINNAKPLLKILTANLNFFLHIF